MERLGLCVDPDVARAQRLRVRDETVVFGRGGSQLGGMRSRIRS